MRKQTIYSLVITLALLTNSPLAQERAKKHQNQTNTTAAAGNQVIGIGSSGRLSKWTGVFGNDTYTLGNSNVFEDKNGNVGIGTTLPTSKLTVAGVVESTSGGVKFPDGTVQTTTAAGALVTVAHNATLTGDGTQASPLGVTSPLEVRDRDNPARQPVVIFNQSFFIVPSGKRLVIEYVSGFYQRTTDSTQQPEDSVIVTTHLNSDASNNRVLGHRTRVEPAPGKTTYVIAQNVRLYADPGTQIVISGLGTTDIASIFLSGYLVDLP